MSEVWIYGINDHRLYLNPGINIIDVADIEELIMLFLWHTSAKGKCEECIRILHTCEYDSFLLIVLNEILCPISNHSDDEWHFRDMGKMSNQFYLAEITHPDEFQQVRNWAASLQFNMIARACYDKRRRPNLSFACLSCGKAYDTFEALDLSSIDEYNGRVYWERRSCICDDENYIIETEMGDIYGHDMVVRAAPNAMLIGRVGAHPILQIPTKTYHRHLKPLPSGSQAPVTTTTCNSIDEINQHILDTKSVRITCNSKQEVLSQWQQ
jgi:hypothetical protein